MLNVICLNAGNYLSRGAQYTNILFDSVSRNLAEGYEARFICFTDDAAGLDPRIDTRPLPNPELKGWWHKLSLFKPGLFDEGDRVLYFDLDTVITGRLDELAALRRSDVPSFDDGFAILRDAYRPAGLQSSIMAWRANGNAGIIWRTWERAGFPEVDGGDQAWIERVPYLEADILQDKFPGLFVSYKVSGGAIPDKASVVFFHGEPRPHEVTTGWVPQVWKVGGLTRAELDTVCNTEREALFANVRENLRARYPAIQKGEPNDSHVVIVGGGPSVKEKIEEIRWRQSLGQIVWSLNGSARWLIDNGIKPDAVVIADARPGNAEFVCGPIGYLLASQCDPAVFRKADEDGGPIHVWHSNAPGVEEILKDEPSPVHLIGGGSTVGLSAIVLAHLGGCRKIHLYGFDSSLAESHHAYPQAQNDGDLIVDVLFGDRKFRAAPWMVQQAQEFCRLATELADDGTIITVAGDGLLPTMARAMMAEPVLTPAEQRVRAIMQRLGNIPSPVGAEIGVFAGDMSAALLRSIPDLTLYMVDSWEGEGAAYTGDSGDWHASLSAEKQRAYRAKAEKVTQDANGRAWIVPMRSHEAARTIPNRALDFVFIDADHSEEGCRSDIETWLPRLKPGGLLCGHDYGNTDFPKFGVTKAVDAFAEQHGLTVDLGENFTWFIRLKETAAIAA